MDDELERAVINALHEMYGEYYYQDTPRILERLARMPDPPWRRK